MDISDVTLTECVRRIELMHARAIVLCFHSVRKKRATCLLDYGIGIGIGRNQPGIIGNDIKYFSQTIGLLLCSHFDCVF